MSRNGSGIYNLPSGNPVVTATTITSTWANTTLGDIATALTGSLAADGQTPATGNLNMNSNQIKNVVDPSLAQDAATKAYVDATIPSASVFLVKADNLSDVANATTARGNLSAAKSGANSDITSLTGLTTALSAAQGGTGITSPGTSGNVLTSNGTAWTSTALAYTGQRSQLFTSSGTFTIPTSVTAVKVSLVGGGGGGAAGAASAGNGAGGGAGGACVGWLTGLTPGNTITATIGAAGTAGSGAGGAGGAGGGTTFSTLTANGGAGGTFNGAGGLGGTCTTGTFYARGGQGGPGGNAYGGSGTVYPTLAAVNWSVGAAAVVSSFANPGILYGGGGGGGDGTGIGYNPAGGAGVAGMILVEW